VKDLRALPRVRDSVSYLYAEHCRVEQDDRAVALHDSEGKIAVPCANLLVLMLGPGTTVTHAAMRALSETSCLVAWTGEEGVRFYAEGLGQTRSAANVQRQARLASDSRLRLGVAAEMYRLRFADRDGAGLSLPQLRGREGIRVREAYAQASRRTGVEWKGRTAGGANEPDPVNSALSWASACLYGICHAAIVAAGYSPALGFIHTGHMRSFVFDVADFYKAELAIPVAFEAASDGRDELEPRVRRACRDAYRRGRLLERIVRDIDRVLASGEGSQHCGPGALPGGEVDVETEALEGEEWRS